MIPKIRHPFRRRALLARYTLALLFVTAPLLAAAPGDAPQRNILFFGDSLTAGYGLSNPETQSYPAQVQMRIDAEHLPWHVVNAGLTGETSAGGLRRVDWVLNQRPDVFVLELGANDGLRGTPTSETQANLQHIIDHVRSRYPGMPIVLAGMRMPPSIGQDYADSFHAIFPALAKKNGVTLIPFLLEGVGAVPELNQGDSIHPSAAGASVVADGVWRVLKPVLAAVDR
jgi:acyl-CoA thioesterase-1